MQQTAITVKTDISSPGTPVCSSSVETIDSLFPQEDPWLVLYTRSRHEKKMAEVCKGLGIPHYLPMRKTVRNYLRKRYETELPLFPGYLFCSIPRNQQRLLYRAGHLAQIFEVPDQKTLFNELSQIDRALKLNAPLRADRWIQKGQRVKIASGPFEGLEGIVSRKKNQHRLVLRVEFIHQVVSLEIDGELLVPIPRH